MLQTAHRFMEYAANWVQLPLPFPRRLMRLRLARPTTMAARAARSVARKAAQAVKRMAPAPKTPLAKKPKGPIANKQQAPLFRWY